MADQPAESVDTAFELEWDRTTVPLEALERALYSLADRLTGTVSAESRCWRLTVQPRASQADPTELGHLLRQTVNDHTLRVRIGEKTDPIRNLVFALAFSKSGLVNGSAD